DAGQQRRDDQEEQHAAPGAPRARELVGERVAQQQREQRRQRRDLERQQHDPAIERIEEEPREILARELGLVERERVIAQHAHDQEQADRRDQEYRIEERDRRQQRLAESALAHQHLSPP